MSATVIRIVVVDDHPVVREGLVAALKDFTVVASFASAEELLAARFEAEVILLDLELPGMSGIEVLPRLTTPALVLTAYATDDLHLQQTWRGEPRPGRHDRARAGLGCPPACSGS